ncbi:HNH endonuclease [Bradyrhizobium sp. NFR13]|uniref:HNH endonuclease n=1 Tax=Bradyrhizobium sp. NFR13 TaxID=1566285 RepID=UPI0008E1B545|nr:HNH endonuclease [Bradyrhizobium sp. NFR13]SFL99943.1 HNH endonuclease [Bradyrhizobium sp. NFR13]
MNIRGQERREFPLSVRKAAFKRCCRDGVPHCETCGCELNGRTSTIYEHVVPDGLGGEPTLDNCKVHCRTCADVKTFTEDNPRMQKADRVLKKSFGLTPRKQKIVSLGFAKRPPQNSASRPVARSFASEESL